MPLYHDYDRVYVFLCFVLLAVRMVADMNDTCNVILNLEQNLNDKKVFRFYCFDPF